MTSQPATTCLHQAWGCNSHATPVACRAQDFAAAAVDKRCQAHLCPTGLV